MAILKLNGQTHFINVSSIEVKVVSNGRWLVHYDRNVASDGEVINEGRSFIVVGGVKSGGARNEWFCYHPEFYGEGNWLPCKSMIEAIKLGAQY